MLIMVPGPDRALIARSMLLGGRAAGLPTMAGSALGFAVHLTAVDTPARAEAAVR
jgi:threonine/homoserine/homoserine lactone efflux protein